MKMRKESAIVVLLMVSVILIAQLNVSGQAPILKTPKYCPTCADLPFRCEEIGLLVPEDTFHDMSEDVGVNVVYGEVVVYKEPDGFLPIVGATVFKLSQKKDAKRLYDYYYSHPFYPLKGSVSNLEPIDIGDEGFSFLSSRGGKYIIFREGKFVVNVFGTASVDSVAKITEQNIKSSTTLIPGFEVIFAIGSLLAVAYLVLKRRR